MLRAALIVTLGLTALTACKDKASDSPTADGTAAVGKATKVPVIPDGLLKRLGSGADMVIATDLSNMSTKPLLAKIPDGVKCVRELLASTGAIVIAIGEHDTVGYIDGAPKDATRACVAQFATALGIQLTKTDAGFELAIPDQPLTVTWQGKLATILQRGHVAPTTEPRPDLVALLGKAPREAKGLIAMVYNPPKHDIKTLVGWLETKPDVFLLTIRFEGLTGGAAHAACEEVIAGFKEAAVAKGFTVDDKWFQITDAAGASTVVGTIPYDFVH